MRFRVVRFKISDDSYETVVTNLPDDKFSPEMLKALYHLRWGIETSFRELKYAVGLSHLHGRKKEYAIQEIFARLTLFNFCEAVSAQAARDEAERKAKEEQEAAAGKQRKYLYQVNHTMAVEICREFLKISDPVSSIDIGKQIRRYVIPIRPGRHYARKMRPQGFIAFTYRVS